MKTWINRLKAFSGIENLCLIYQEKNQALELLKNFCHFLKDDKDSLIQKISFSEKWEEKSLSKTKNFLYFFEEDFLKEDDFFIDFLKEIESFRKNKKIILLAFYPENSEKINFPHSHLFYYSHIVFKKKILENDFYLSPYSKKNTNPFLSAILKNNRLKKEKNKVKEFYLSLFENFPALIWRAGKDGLCNYFNKSWLDFTGRTLEQECGNGWTEGVHPDDLKKCVEEYRGYFEKRESFALLYRLRRFDGEYRWIRDYGMPFYSLENEFLGYIGSCYDISIDIQKDLKILEMKVQNEENEKLLDRIYKGIPDVVYSFSEEKKCGIYYSPNISMIFGYEKDYMLNHPSLWFESILEEDREKVIEAVESYKTGKNFDIEYRIRNKNGKIVWLRDRSISAMGKQENVMIEGVVSDITNFKNTQKTLGRVGKKYQNLFNGMLEGFAYHQMVLDENGNLADYIFLEVNPAFERLTGLKRVEIIGKTIREVTPGIEKIWFERYGLLYEKEKNIHFEDYSKELKKYYEVEAFSTEKGFFATLFSDISEKKNSENKILVMNEEIKKKEELYRSLFDYAPVGIYVLEENIFIDINYEALSIFSMKKEALLGKDIRTASFKLVDKSLYPIHPNGYYSYKVYISQKPLINIQIGIVQKSGDILWVLMNAFPLKDGKKVIVTFLDITDRVQIQNSLSNLVKRYRRSISHLLFTNFWLTEISKQIDPIHTLNEMLLAMVNSGIVDGVFIYEKTNKTDVFAKKSAFLDETVFNTLPDKIIIDEKIWTDFKKPVIIKDYLLLPETVRDFFIPFKNTYLIVFPIIKNNEKSGFSCFLNVKGKAFGGNLRNLLEIVSHSIGIILSKHDSIQKINIMEEEKIIQEKYLQRTEKLAALGSLMSAIGHEINQPLQIIKVLADSILFWSKNEEKKPGIEKMLQSFEKISLEVVNADKVIKGMKLLLQSPDKIEIQTLSLRNTLLPILDVYQAKLKEHQITLSLSLLEKDDLIRFSRVQFQQVVINLIDNAIHALDKKTKTGKMIQIESRKENSEIFLVFKDNGIGVSSEIKEKIFDPFFTTNLAKDSMGLGLYLVHSILKVFNASIKVENNEFGGAGFVIKFEEVKE